MYLDELKLEVMKLHTFKSRFGHKYHNLQSRVTKTLLNAFLDPTKAMTQHYGAIQGLAALGPNVVRLLILPNLEPYLQLLEPEMLLEKQKNEAKRNEAWRVYGSLMYAAGHCLYEKLKLFPGLLSGPMRRARRTNKMVLSNIPSKRKSSTDPSAQQPALKKLSADGAVGMPAISVTMTADMQGAADGFPASSRQTGSVPSPLSGQVQSISGASRRERGDSHIPKSSLILAQAWKEDVDAGNLLASLFELFGEGMLSFTQPAELSCFL